MLLDLLTLRTAFDRQREAAEKTRIEGILYIAERLEEPGFHNTFKMMYFADKHHLEKYGRLIFHDSYIAMKDGPVPSEAYDLAKAIRRGYGSYLPFDVHGGYRLEIKRSPDLSALIERSY